MLRTLKSFWQLREFLGSSEEGEMAKCLTHASTLSIGLILSLRKKGERRALTCLGGSYWGTVGGVAFGTR